MGRTKGGNPIPNRTWKSELPQMEDQDQEGDTELFFS